jgi:hypothetical protein
MNVGNATFKDTGSWPVHLGSRGSGRQGTWELEIRDCMRDSLGLWSVDWGARSVWSCEFTAGETVLAVKADGAARALPARELQRQA